MRIVFIVHQFPPEFFSGTERFTYAMARAMQRAGHYVHILTCSLMEASEQRWQTNDTSPFLQTTVDGIPVSAIPRQLLGRMAELDLNIPSEEVRLHLRKFFEGKAFDVCHVTHSMRMFGAIAIVRELQLPYIVTLTDFFLACYRINLVQINNEYCDGPAQGSQCLNVCLVPPWTNETLMRRRDTALSLLSSATTRVACSEFVREKFAIEFPDMHFHTVRHGVDLLRFSGPNRRRRGRDGSDIVFGYIGTLSEQKGVHILARAFHRVEEKNVRLRIVGPDYGNTRLVEELNAVASVDKRVSVEPARPFDEVPHLLGEFDVLCLPSLVPEAGSISIQEGFAAGLPTISSNLGFFAECHKTYGCGCVVPPGDIIAWADCITKVARDRNLLADWARLVPLSRRVEEEAALYESLYRHAVLT